MPTGAFLFVPDGPYEPIYAIVRKAHGISFVKFFTMTGETGRGRGRGNMDILYEEASKYGKFIPLVAIFSGHDLRRTVAFMRHTRPKTTAVATGNGQSQIATSGNGAVARKTFVLGIRDH